MASPVSITFTNCLFQETALFIELGGATIDVHDVNLDLPGTLNTSQVAVSPTQINLQCAPDQAASGTVVIPVAVNRPDPTLTVVNFRGGQAYASWQVDGNPHFLYLSSGVSMTLNGLQN